MDVNLLTVTQLYQTKVERAPFVLECQISGEPFQLGLSVKELGRLHEMLSVAMDRLPPPGERMVAQAGR